MDDPLSCEDVMVGVVSVNGGVASAEDWRKALNKVIPAVVVLKITTCRAFDTAIARVSGATGFVVDKHRGIILTNRHVVGPGPVVAQAIFLNREEVPVYPLYRDPVHDFGFFRYDPSAIQFLDYEQIPLAPEAACVGLEIRVVGNDGGEKLSILAGTIARLDRDAPHYKKDGYNDFNTFYMQAASGTKGGSSGSPVIDWQGRAVALNAGSKAKGASAFFLPLHRVVRALSFFLQEEEVVASIPSRGTLQATFHHKGFHEIRRLGLRGQTEQMVRHSSPAGETGMLVVHSVVPGGPAHQHLQPGDILICVNGEVLTEFLKLETLLDDSVNQKIGLQIERGGVAFCVNLMVQDLHSITPNFFLQISGAVIHPLSYQQARNFHFNCGLVYVAKPGYVLSRAGVPRHAIIKKFAGQEISLLDELILALSKLSRGDRVPLEYITYTNRHRSQSALVTVDRHEWYPLPLIYTRDDYNGSWTTMPAFPLGSPFLSLKVHCHGKNIVYETATPIDSEVACLETMLQHTKIDRTDSSTRLCTDDDQEADEFHDSEELNIETEEHKLEEVYGDGIDNSDKIEERVEEKLEIVHSTAEQVIEDSLVMLEVDVPSSCLLDGVHLQHLFGTGVVIYHSQSMGLVAIDKSTVPVSVSDVMLSFSAYPMEIPGEVVFLHPVHNYALIAYDPSALGPTGASAVRAAELLPETALQRGDSVHLVGLSRSLQVKSRISTVTNPSAALSIGFAKCPRYRATNMDLIELTTDFGTTFSGVLTDKLGRVQAIWGSFSTQLKCKDYPLVRGIPIYAISEVLEKIVSGAKGPPLVINGIKRPMPLVRILEAELYPTLLSKARSFGLSDNWIQALVKKDPIRRQVLRVKGCLAGSKAERVLKQGDMILAIKNEHITCFRDIELACKELDSSEESKGELNMKILREGQEIELLVGTDVRDGNGTTRMVNWCGCVLQDPHSAVRALGFLPKEGHGVYVTRWCRGSPVHRYGLFSLQWIIEINGRRTPDLDSFVEVAAGLEHDEFIRVKTIRLNGKSQVLTLKQDLHYWPTWEVKFDPETVMWHHKIIKALDGSAL